MQFLQWNAVINGKNKHFVYRVKFSFFWFTKKIISSKRRQIWIKIVFCLNLNFCYVIIFNSKRNINFTVKKIVIFTFSPVDLPWVKIFINLTPNEEYYDKLRIELFFQEWNDGLFYFHNPFDFSLDFEKKQIILEVNW